MAPLCYRIFAFLKKHEALVEQLVGSFTKATNPKGIATANVKLLRECVMVTRVTKGPLYDPDYPDMLVFATRNKILREIIEDCEETFGYKTKENEDWPAGDYTTWSDVFNASDIMPYRYVQHRIDDSDETNTPILKDDNVQGYWQAIYIAFVAPFIMAKFSVAYPLVNPDRCRGTFVFVYRGGGAGCLVKGMDNTVYALSCGHTFAYEAEVRLHAIHVQCSQQHRNSCVCFRCSLKRKTQNTSLWISEARSLL